MLGAIKACVLYLVSKVTDAFKHQIKFRLHDDAGKPMPGITVKVTLPDKSIEEKVSDKDGLIQISLAEAGACTLDLSWEGKTVSNTVFMK